MRFKHLHFPDTWKHYWTKYPEGYTILESLMSWVSQVDTMVDTLNLNTEEVKKLQKDIEKHVTRLEKEIETKLDILFTDELGKNVTDILNDWLDIGKLADIINYEVFDMKADKSSLTVNIQDYKHLVSDNDWKPAIDQALADANKVFFPRGLYPTKTVNVPSYKEIEGDGEDTVFVPLEDDLFKVQGTVGTETPLTSDAVIPTAVLYVEDVNEIMPNDYILLKSQRECLTVEDAGPEWCLGNATPNAPGLYFGEFLQVHQVVEKRIETTAKPIYYNYLHHNTNETSPQARPSSTVQKVNFARNVKFRNFRVSKTTKRTFHFLYALNCVVEKVVIYDDVYVDHGSVDFIYMVNSLNCTGVDCWHEFTNIIHPGHYYDINIYKIRSCQNSGFLGCYTKNGGQPFDITYETQSIPSTNCFVDNCTIDRANHTGITTHGGVFQTQLINNKLRECAQGINIRARNSIITNNSITVGKEDGGAYGIAMYDAWAVDCVVSGNTINGYIYGIAIADSSNYFFGRIGTIISNNTVKNFKYGFYLSRSRNNKSVIYTALQIIANTFQAIGEPGETIRGMHFDSYAHGVHIENNNLAIYGDTTGSTAIHFENNANRESINGNIVRGFAVGIRIGAISDTEALGTTRGAHTVKGNRFVAVATSYDIVSTAYRNIDDPVSSVTLRQLGSSVDIPPNSLFTLPNGNLYWKNQDGDAIILLAKQ